MYCSASGFNCPSTTILPCCAAIEQLARVNRCLSLRVVGQWQGGVWDGILEGRYTRGPWTGQRGESFMWKRSWLAATATEWDPLAHPSYATLSLTRARFIVYPRAPRSSKKSQDRSKMALDPAAGCSSKNAPKRIRAANAGRDENNHRLTPAEARQLQPYHKANCTPCVSLSAMRLGTAPTTAPKDARMMTSTQADLSSGRIQRQ